MGSKITRIEYYLPETVLTNEELSREFPDWTPEKIEQKIGIRTRHITRKDETALDLAYQAALKVLEGTDRSTVDFVLLCTQSPDYFLPTSACILQDKLGLPTTAGALDFNLGCSGFIYGLAVAKGLISAGIARKVLLLTSETYTKFIHPKDKGNKTIFGDAAAATLVEFSDREAIFEFDLGTDGAGMNNLIVRNCGIRNPIDPKSETINEAGEIIPSGNHIFMNGPEIFNFTIKTIPVMIESVLRKNKLTMNEIDFCVFHQANKYMLDYLRQKLKVPTEKYYNDMLETGNTVSATIPIGLFKAREKGQIRPGSRVLLCGFGVGYSWGATIIQIQ